MVDDDGGGMVFIMVDNDVVCDGGDGNVVCDGDVVCCCGDVFKKEEEDVAMVEKVCLSLLENFVTSQYIKKMTPKRMIIEMNIFAMIIRRSLILL